MLNKLTINRIEDKASVKELYKASFPKEEQLPWWTLKALTKINGVDILGFYDKDTLCGFAFTIRNKKILYIMFLAVSKEFQSKGYGSQIINIFKNEDQEKQIVLIVEPLDEKANNYKDRVRRMLFYEKNGFFDTGYNIKEVGGIFRVLSTYPTLDTNEFLKIYKKISFGLWRPRITKI